MVIGKTHAQFSLKQENYNAFDGRIIPAYSIESKYTVLFIDTSVINRNQLKDTATLVRIVQRVDTLYAFYKNNLGYDPVGGNPNYGYKANVFFGPPSCGAGCGLIGAKGIEVDGFSGIYYNHKYKQNVNRDVIIGYEFGRNFFNFSDKILFPFRPNTDDKNGGFAEAFAAIMYQYAFDEIMDDPAERQMNETLMNLEWSRTWSRGYINDTSANPYNSFARWDLDGVLDPNRGRAGHNASAYFSTVGVFPIFDIFGKNRMFPGFFKNIREQPSVVTIEDALSNIAYAASKTIQTNLNAFFINVLKYKLNKQAIDQIALFPKAPSKLISDEPLLYFFSPFDTIPLNLRSTNYLDDGYSYMVKDGNDTLSFSKHGNNYFSYSLLRNRHFIQLDCYLINTYGERVDSFSTVLRKRDRIHLFEKAQQMFAYYLTNETTRSYFKDSVLVIEGLATDKKTINRGLVYWSTVNRRDRIIKLEGSIRNASPKGDYTYPVLDGLPSTGFSFLRYGGPQRNNGTARVGYDLAVDDSLSFHHLNMVDSSTLFVPPPEQSRKYNLINVEFSTSGFGTNGYFKNVVLSDITDTDGDGVLDFDDDCPTVSTHPSAPRSIDTVSCTNANQFSLNLIPETGHRLLWYPSNEVGEKEDTFSNIVLSGSNSKKTIFVSQMNLLNGCESKRSPIVITLNSSPSKPILSFAANSNGQVCLGENSTQMKSSSIIGNLQWQKSTNGLDYTDLVGFSDTTYLAANLNVSTYFKIIASNLCGSAESDSKLVTVNPKPTVSFNVNNASQVLTGNSFVFTNTSTGGSTYLWRFGNGVTATTQNATYSYAAAGSYVVRLVVTSAAGCRDSSSTTVTVTAPPPPPVAAGNLYAAGTTCAQFNARTAIALNRLCYTVTSGRVSAVTPSSFMYYVKVTAPSASFTVNISQTVSRTGFRLFTVNTGGSVVSGDNCARVTSVSSPSTGQARAIVTRATVGRTYIIGVRYDTRSLVGYTTNGTLSANYSFNAKIGNTTLSNSTSTVTLYPNNCVGVSSGQLARMPELGGLPGASAGVDKTGSEARLAIRVYPNPSNNRFNVLIEGSDRQTKGVLRIMNAQGQIVEEIKDVKPGMELQLGVKYTSGTYTAVFIQGNQTTRQRMVKY
jgi:PKD repeat protein